MKKVSSLFKVYLLWALAIFNTTIMADTITVYCPTIDQIVYTTSTDPWAAFNYSATVPIALLVMGNKLSFIGHGYSSAAKNMNSAVWSDGSLNCNYDGNKDYMVLTSDYLAKYVDRCYFAGNSSYCDSTNPMDCPMTCETKVDHTN